MEQSPYQQWMEQSTGEVDPPEACEHKYVRFNPSTGITRCLNPECEEEVDIAEIADSLPAEWFAPYDLILEL